LETSKGPETDESTGMMRIECTVVATGKVGFITMQGNQGTKYIELVSPFSIFCTELEKTLDESGKAIAKTNGWFNNKTKELNTQAKDANMNDARSEFQKLRQKVSGAQAAINKLKQGVVEGKKDFAKKEIDEENAHIEAKERKAADAIMEPAKVKFDAMNILVQQLDDLVKPFTSLSGEELDAFETPLAISESAEKLVESIVAACKETKAIVMERQVELPKVPKGPMLDAKKEMLKMNTSAEANKRKANGFMDAVRNKCSAILATRNVLVSGALRTQLLTKELTYERFFMELVKPGDEKISEEAFCSLVQGLVPELKAEHIKLVARKIESGGISRRRFQAFLQQYFVVVKSVAFTNDFEIKGAKTLRKAELDELVELIEGPKMDDKLGITRVKAKSLSDGTEGWLSMKGNQGSAFLTEVEKPYYSLLTETSLDREFKSEGEAGLVRALKADEVVELIEGPRKVCFDNGIRVKGKCISDGAMGWFTAKDKTGTVFAEADSKYYSCTSSVAMTDNMDIKDCKVIRKLAVGELFTVEEGPLEEKEAGITRVKGKSLKDEQVGWITIKGNAGTVYAEASSKHFCVLQDMSLTKKFPSNNPGEEVRTVLKGEAMQVLEGPKEETYAPEVRVKVLATRDGATGWITVKKAPEVENTKIWTPLYTCKIASAMTTTLTVEGAEEVRKVEVGEKMELLEGPSEDGQVLRMKARFDKDGAVGWVTIKDAENKRAFV